MPKTRLEPFPSIPPTVAAKLSYYVYLYVDPRDESVFYVGKGKGARALAHLDGAARKGVQDVLRELKRAGLNPRIDILAHGLPSADAAFRVESAAIDLLGIDSLANAVRGHYSRNGRMTIEEAVGRYTRKPARIKEPSILIRVSRLYHFGITDQELYDATRSAWKVGPKREKAELAFAVHDGVIRESYRIHAWFPGGTTYNVRFDGRAHEKEVRGRWEFVGVIADEAIRKRYVNRYVGNLFSQGAQNPIAYVNIA